MKHEILFRGKAINRDKGYHRTNYKNGDWVYGLVARLYDERFENLPAEMIDINGISGIEVNYKTVGQSTGVKTYSKHDDKLHKIYDDDLCYVTEFDREGKDEQHLCQVMFDCGTFYFKDVNSDWCRAFYEIEDIESDVELVGNIHDNPEILKNPNS